METKTILCSTSFLLTLTVDLHCNGGKTTGTHVIIRNVLPYMAIKGDNLWVTIFPHRLMQCTLLAGLCTPSLCLAHS